ncbi:MAG: threonine--tRNA ligase [Kribbellaceae bacterium]
MSEVKVLLVGVEGEAERSVTETTTVGEVFAEIFGQDRSAIAARVNGELRDLSHALADGDQVEPVRNDSEDGRAIIRHSTAHVLAQAVQNLFPDAKLGIGPPVENGFYYDFDVAEPFTPDDLSKLEKKMQQIIKERQRFSRRVVSDSQARDELAGEPYKLELIGLKSADAAEGAGVEVGAGELTVYDNLRRDDSLAWKDLCRGPHVPATGYLGNFKLMRVAAAYWRGSENNPQLQRIYGTAWESKDKLKEYLQHLEEAAKRDHRKLGQELDLFSFPEEIGSGLAVFHPKGGVLRKVMEDYSRQRHVEDGYEFVYSPHITKAKLFEVSGHLDWYSDGMYPPMHLDAELDAEGNVRKPGQDYYLKPMNCPMHNLIYRARGRSYRELPLRFFEFGSVYRYEKSGVVHGLTRARGFSQDDAHIYCTQEQMQGEIRSLLQFVLDLLRDYGLDDFYLELSTRDQEKSIGSDEDWERATDALREAAEASGLELVLDPGGAAFYAPKISVQAKDAIGRSWQLSTIQVDLMEPGLFGLEYTSADGSRQEPIMIHRALFGSIERFFAVLTEHYAGAFPAWLAPVQVRVLGVRDDHDAYAFRIADRLRGEGFRSDVVEASDKLGSRIRKAKLEKIPYVLVVGDDDVEHGTVGVNRRGSDEPERGVKVDDFVDRLRAEVTARVTS